MRNNHNNNSPIVLNVAEKPSVARALQQVFGRLPGAANQGLQREGPLQIFTHDGVQFPTISGQGQGQDATRTVPATPHTMITTSVRGHLASYDFDSNQYGWNKVDPIELFQAPIQTFYRNDMQPIEQLLRRLSRQATHVILWLDCDREGEAIGEEVQNVCIQANPRLQQQDCIYRAKFSTVLEPEIRRALSTLGRLQDPLVQAVLLRSELDLRVGAAFTRFQTQRLQRQFELDQPIQQQNPYNGNNNNLGNHNNNGSSSSVLSYGPCQFPTLGFVVERWARIQTFVPVDFWSIELSLICPPSTTTTTNGDDDEGSSNNNNNSQSNDGNPYRSSNGSNSHGSSSNNNNRNNSRPIYFNWKRSRLYDQLLATILFETCLEAGEAVVVSLQGRPKNKWRPVPLATVELQKRASRYLRIGSESLMAAAEDLYQQGYISYPRTETERFRPEFQHQPLFQQFASLGGAYPEWSNYANQLLNGGAFQNPRQGQNDDQAHPPITPCKAVDPNTITDATQRGVYTLVVKHYLACCSRDAVGRETTLTVRVADEEFTATGLMILEHNWLEIYRPWERWSTGQGELPPVQVGSRIRPHSLTLKQGRTTAPTPLSEVELISLMDRNGIGTDATIAQHITTIQDRKYAVKDGAQKFLPTPLGIALVQGYNSMGYQLNKPDLRREMEAECNHVAAGRKTKAAVLVPLLNKMKQTYETAVAEAQKLDDAMAQHFQRVGTSQASYQVMQANFSLCGRCQGPMALKQQQQQQQQRGRGNNNNNNSPRKLLYCGTCQEGLQLPRGKPHPHTNPATQQPMTCPICNYQVLHIQRGDGYDGNGYHVCPKCFSNPPQEHGGGMGDFRCFNCTNAACSLASGTSSSPAFACPFCRGQNPPGQICLRKNSKGWVLSCNQYSSRRCNYTMWMPKETQSASVVMGNENAGENSHHTETSCQGCSNSTGGPVRLIHFKWRPGSRPSHEGTELTTCVLCDTEFRQEFGIRTPTQDGVNASRPTASRGGGRGRGRGGGGGGTSFGRGRGGTSFGRGRGSHGNNGYNSSYNSNNGGGRGGGGGLTCFRCGQPGHFANACPQGRS